MELDLSTLVQHPQTPAASNALLKMRNIEDSGYHTPFTPSLSELSGALDGSCDARMRYHSIVTLDSNSISRRKLIRTPFSDDALRPETSPVINNLPRRERCAFARRPLKRSLEESNEKPWSLGAASTPTSVIAGDLEKLCVQSPAPVPAPPVVSHCLQRDFTTSDYFSLSSIGETSRPLSYPTTPVKSSRCKIAKLSPRCERKSCTKNYSPSKAIKENCYPRRSVKKLNFVRGLSHKELPAFEPRSRPTVIPDRKVDIITKLHERRLPALSTILGCLNAVDVHNFSSVCQTWRFICDSNVTARCKREKYEEYIKVTKENYDNRDNKKKAERERSDSDKLRLRDIHNVICNRRSQPAAVRSPPGTPRTNKFRKFTKSASLDDRVQVWCVRCCQPAKVTAENSGEQWAQCSSDTCAFAFCRYCKCARHPDKTCHSVDAPSPTKRRKHSYHVVDSKKCRKNLRRLLD